MTSPFRWHCGPRVDSASNRNDYQGCLPRVKVAGAKGWHLATFMCRFSTNSRSPNPFQVLGPLKACIAIALLSPRHAGSSTAPPIPNLRTTCSLVVKFPPRRCKPSEELRQPISPRPVWIAWKQEKSPVPAEIRTPDRPARSLDTVSNTLSHVL